SYTSSRTQIYIPEYLREEIEKHRSVAGETLSEYLRRSAIERIAREKKKKADLKKLADEVIGSIKPGTGGWADVKDTYKYIRKTREEEDEHWLKRWGKAKKD
ncbi:MAG: hypothetical protein AAB685_03185, partial [Patescibacteria group bacterium]